MLAVLKISCTIVSGLVIPITVRGILSLSPNTMIPPDVLAKDEYVSQKDLGSLLEAFLNSIWGPSFFVVMSLGSVVKDVYPISMLSPRKK